MRRENLYTDHYRRNVPPWVILPIAEDGR